ncbi:phosphonopyruvate decarboxylase [Candidatus Woesearchaeota archaeon]|nr:phosphonopyruvate decarboxylase [Candidatus Woesearchaeota archaeon]
MISPKDFVNELRNNELDFFVEVPCSIFKDLLNYMWDNNLRIINPVNEGVALSIASGYYTATKKIPVVMMQNSGFGNTINPLTSLNQIYNIPVLYLISWRGFGGKGKDAPEHDIMGESLEEILRTFKISYYILEEDNYKEQIEKAIKAIKLTSRPVALILKKGMIAPYRVENKKVNHKLSRLDAIGIIKEIAKDAVFISSTGYPSRDSFQSKDTNDFYMLGSMGHTLPFGIGVALNTRKKVIIFDGDGSSLMHLGSLITVAIQNIRNLIYIILDNNVHDSTGGQPTGTDKINFEKIMESFNFRNIAKIEDEDNLRDKINNFIKKDGPSFLHIMINQESKIGKRVSDDYSCEDIKNRFMKELEK